MANLSGQRKSTSSIGRQHYSTKWDENALHSRPRLERSRIEPREILEEKKREDDQLNATVSFRTWSSNPSRGDGKHKRYTPREKEEKSSGNSERAGERFVVPIFTGKKLIISKKKQGMKRGSRGG